MERGERVKCIYPGSYSLTFRKFYEILSIEDDWLTLRDDQGIIARYAGVRFERVKDSPKRADRTAA